MELECLVENLGEMVLLWKRGARVLTAGEMMVRRDRRISLRGTNLVITGVTAEDQGEYECEVSRRTFFKCCTQWFVIARTCLVSLFQFKPRSNYNPHLENVRLQTGRL